MTGLRAHLGVTRGYSDDLRVAGALRRPWCWPRAPHEIDEARAIAPPPPPPAPGEVLLVSVEQPPADGRAIWRLHRSATPSDIALPIVRDASFALDRASRIVTRDLPLLASLASLERPGTWNAELIVREGGSAPRDLDGASYGLAFLLAHASLLMNRPVPGTIATSASLSPTGDLGGVEGIEDKIRVLDEWALGIEELLVAEEIAERARAAAARVGATFRIVGLRTAADSFAHVFPDARRSRREGADPAELRREADHIFRLALKSKSPLLDWRCVARAATALLEEAGASDNDILAEKVRFARSVAQRHGGIPSALAWPSEALLASMVPYVRNEYAAHVVQSARDDGSDDLSNTIERGKTLIPPPTSGAPSELVLLGAIGRALAALRRYDEAATVLHKAVEGWFAIFAPADASHAICELVRVVAVLGDAKAYDALAPRVDEVDREADPRHHSGAFLALARGRASLLLGRTDEALHCLDDVRLAWDETPMHVALSRQRLLARALASSGREAAAMDIRARIAHDVGDDPSTLVFAKLAVLDQALAQGERDAKVLDRITAEICGPCEPGARWLRVKCDDPAEAARIVADEFPY